MTASKISSELEEWAVCAGYIAVHENGPLILFSEGGENRYYLRERHDGWYTLGFASRGGKEYLRLAAVTKDVLEYYLIGFLGNSVRDERNMPFLHKPHEVSDVADGYAIGSMEEDGFRKLRHDGGSLIAAAKDETRSLLALIPLSHYLRLSLAQLKESFLSVDGFPLMRNGRYLV